MSHEGEWPKTRNEPPEEALRAVNWVGPPEATRNVFHSLAALPLDARSAFVSWLAPEVVPVQRETEPPRSVMRKRVADMLEENDACGSGPLSRQEYLADADALLALIGREAEDTEAIREKLEDCERAHAERSRALRPDAVSPFTLRAHYLAEVVCDHERKMDQPRCSCSLVNLGWHPSVGEAVDAWIEHAVQAERESLARLDTTTGERADG